MSSGCISVAHPLSSNLVPLPNRSGKISTELFPLDTPIPNRCIDLTAFHGKVLSDLSQYLFPEYAGADAAPLGHATVGDLCLDTVVFGEAHLPFPPVPTLHTTNRSGQTDLLLDERGAPSAHIIFRISTFRVFSNPFRPSPPCVNQVGDSHLADHV